MSDPALAPSVSWLKYLRFPMLFLLLGTLAWLGCHYLIDTEQSSHNAAIGKAATVLSTILLLIFWLYFSSGLKKSRVAIGVLLVFGLFFAIFRPKPDGSMNISFELRRWVAKLLGLSHEDAVNRQRQKQEPVETTGVDLRDKPGEWPEYRGKGRRGIYDGSPINLAWEAQPPKELWRHLIGEGYASFVVANGYLVSIEQRSIDGEDREVVACYQASTGLEVWQASWKGRFDEAMGGPGPRATPTIADGDVYALGANGRLVRIDGRNGTVKWAVETLEGNANLPWAMSGSPLVYGNRVVVAPGTQSESSIGKAVRAFDRETGKEIWASGTAQGSYSSPMLMTLSGKEQLLVFDGAGLVSYDPNTGTESWRQPWNTNPPINVAQPIQISEDRVLIASGYNAGAALIEVQYAGDKWSVREVWRTKPSVMRCKFASPVVHEGTLYGLNDGYLEAVDLGTGKQLWKDDRRRFKPGEAYGHGQLIRVGNHLLALTEYGELVLIETSPKELIEKARLKVLSGRCWNNFAVVDGIIYLRNDREMTAFDLRPGKK